MYDNFDYRMVSYLLPYILAVILMSGNEKILENGINPSFLVTMATIE